jgi:hypothetical protein
LGHKIFGMDAVFHDDTNLLFGRTGHHIEAALAGQGLLRLRGHRRAR